MTDDAIERLLSESRAQAFEELRQALRGASADALERIAVAIVPLLFKHDYVGEPAGKAEHHGDAVAVSRSPALPPFLVRVHRGTFGDADVEPFREATSNAQVAQAALAVIADRPMTPATRERLGTLVPWLLDTDGLARMMLAGNLGVTSRTFEVKRVDGSYFR